MKRKTRMIGAISLMVLLAAAGAAAAQSAKAEPVKNLNLVVDAAILDGMRQTTASHPTLSAISTVPTPLDPEDVFYRLTGNRPDESFQQSEFLYPPGEGSSRILWKGREPAYEQFLNVESTSLDTRICYTTERYDYIDAVFYPADDLPGPEQSDLSFMDAETVTGELTDAAAFLGLALADVSCRSLSADTLQSLYDHRLETGTLRDQRYASPGSTSKDRSYTAQRPRWTADDECCYLTGQPCLFGVPVFGAEISACRDRTGWIHFSATGLVDADPREPQPAAGVDTVLAAVERIVPRFHSVDTPVLQSAELYYYPIAQGQFVPAWRMEIGYVFIDGDGITEQRTAAVWINACDGSELPEANA